MLSFVVQSITAEIQGIGFKRIRSLSEIESGFNYVIMAIDQQGVGHILTSVEKKNGKLAAKTIKNTLDTLWESSHLDKWNIQRNQKGYTLCVDTTSKCIKLGKSATDLLIGTEPSYWNFEMDDTTFVCKSVKKEKTSRCIKYSEGETCDYFGYYVTDNKGYLNLSLYKEFSYSVSPADSTLDESGTKRLTGGWTKEQLAKVDFEGVSELDLTGIRAWPISTMPFLHWKEPCNVLIYVDEGHKEKVHKEWKNVVVCSANGNYLLRPMVLCDKTPFRFSRAFHVGTDSLSYLRHITDSNWETLYLPFRVTKMPPEFLFKTVDGIKENGLITSEAHHGEAYTPLLFKRNEGGSVSSLSFFSEDQIVSMKKEDGMEDGFYGNMSRKTILENNENAFFLNMLGTSFVKAAPTSYLDPFRCYLIYKNEQHQSKSITIDNENTTTIFPAISQKGGTVKIYSIKGILLSEGKTWNEATKNLNAGIYIENRKIIKK